MSHWLGKQSDAPPEAGPGPTIPAGTQTWGNEVSQGPQKEFQWPAISNENFSYKYHKDFSDPGANSQKKHKVGSSRSASTHFSLESVSLEARPPSH